MFIIKISNAYIRILRIRLRALGVHWDELEKSDTFTFVEVYASTQETNTIKEFLDKNCRSQYAGALIFCTALNRR